MVPPRTSVALSERLVTRVLGNLTTLSIPHRRPSFLWTCPSCQRHTDGLHLRVRARAASSSSSSQWKARQKSDHYTRDARTLGLKSRAAFKLLEMDAKYNLFRRNQTIIDLGYAPGSWSQVAVERTRPHGVVVGIDLVPAQPPRGMTSIQGDFLSPQVRKLLRDVLTEQVRRKKEERALERRFEGALRRQKGGGGGGGEEGGVGNEADKDGEVVPDRPSYIDLEKAAALEIEATEASSEDDGKMVDVVISDMSEEIWPQTSGFRSKTLSNPYRRLMNTSGIKSKDHIGSMELCYAALAFASDNLKPNGHFVCKFYQGGEDKLLQTKLKKMFTHVYREKPDSSRKDSKEAYFVGLKRKQDVTLASIEGLSNAGVKESTLQIEENL